MKLGKNCIFTILSILLIFFIIVSLPWLMMFVCSFFEPNPPTPEVEYGEFPFYLEYEINGKIIQVEDKVICEYAGIGFGDNGKFLKWKKWVASTGNEDLLLLSDDNKKIFYTVGNADYYMGEKQEESLKPQIYMNEYKNSITISSADPVELEKYNIKILDYKFSQPIKNQFR